MRHNGLPQLGNASFRIGVDHANPNALAILLFALAPDSIPFAGPCSLLVSPASALPAIFTITSGNGTNQFLLPIPADPGLTGLQLYCQWAIDDPQGAPLPGLQGLAGSRGARVIVGN